MFEISESRLHKPVPEREAMIQDTIQGAINTSLVQPGDEIVSIYPRRLEKGRDLSERHNKNSFSIVGELDGTSV